jgi:pyridoxamine 5'-phosphate oxidase
MDNPPFTEPFAWFKQWYEEAEAAEPNDPNAMSLATIGEDGLPSVRIVLLKEWDRRGFVFYTNLMSDKGRALAARPQACLNFHWKSLGRQVRIAGGVERVGEEEADVYFASRPRISQLGAWASKQSRALDSRAALLARVEEVDKAYGEGAVPRPPHWSGFRVSPRKIEFWQAGEFRLHDRFLFTRMLEEWKAERLYP